MAVEKIELNKKHPETFVWPWQLLAFWTKAGESKTSAEHSVASLESKLHATLLQVAEHYPAINMQDYDMAAIRQGILYPIATYLQSNLSEKKQNTTKPWHRFLRKKSNQKPNTTEIPLIVSGEPGIGKTTLCMLIDEALTCLFPDGTFSTRQLVSSGIVQSHFEYKSPHTVTPLLLGDTKTAVLSVNDWASTERHYTFDTQGIFKRTPESLAAFYGHLKGKVVFMDDVEETGAHFSLLEEFAKQGILVILSSNIPQKDIHLPIDQAQEVILTGIDHRKGDISKVCVSNHNTSLFRTLTELPNVNTDELSNFKIVERNGLRIAYSSWRNLQSKGFLKGQFSESFKNHDVQGVVIDSIPYFSGLKPDDVDRESMDELYRFVHLLDAIHDNHLPLLIRLTNTEGIPSTYTGEELKLALELFDKKEEEKRLKLLKQGNNQQQQSSISGSAMWTYMTRCLSRLRSRQALNTVFFAEFMANKSTQLTQPEATIDMPEEFLTLGQALSLEESIRITSAFRSLYRRYGKTWDVN